MSIPAAARLASIAACDNWWAAFYRTTAPYFFLEPLAFFAVTDQGQGLAVVADDAALVTTDDYALAHQSVCCGICATSDVARRSGKWTNDGKAWADALPLSAHETAVATEDAAIPASVGGR